MALKKYWWKKSIVNLSDEYLVKDRITFDDIIGLKLPIFYEKENILMLMSFLERIDYDLTIIDIENEIGIDKNVLIKVIEENKIKELINKKRFQYLANMDNPMGFYPTPQSLYYDIIHQFFASVNNILSFDECYIEYNLDTYIFSIISFDEEIKIVTPSIEKIDGSYINKIIVEIEKAIKENDYNSATTKSRTLIEETLIYGLQHKNVVISSKGDINKLFNQFKEAYNIKVGKDVDVRLNTIVSSLIKIITAVAELRNANSDSHGVGDNNRFELKERDIRLLSNSSGTLANYLLGIIEDD